MKILWSIEPIGQSPATTKNMYNIIKQLAGAATNVELGFVSTRTEIYLNSAFDIPDDNRFTLYPLNLLNTTLRKSRIKIEDKRIHIVDYETRSNTKAVDSLLKLAKMKKSRSDCNLHSFSTRSRALGFRKFRKLQFIEVKRTCC